MQEVSTPTIGDGQERRLSVQQFPRRFQIQVLNGFDHAGLGHAVPIPECVVSKRCATRVDADGDIHGARRVVVLTKRLNIFVYSRSATVGASLDARWAGNHAASTHTTPRAPIASTNDVGSSGLNP